MNNNWVLLGIAGAVALWGGWVAMCARRKPSPVEVCCVEMSIPPSYCRKCDGSSCADGWVPVHSEL